MSESKLVCRDIVHKFSSSQSRLSASPLSPALYRTRHKQNTQKLCWAPPSNQGYLTDCTAAVTQHTCPAVCLRQKSHNTCPAVTPTRQTQEACLALPCSQLAPQLWTQLAAGPRLKNQIPCLTASGLQQQTTLCLFPCHQQQRQAWNTVRSQT